MMDISDNPGTRNPRQTPAMSGNNHGHNTQTATSAGATDGSALVDLLKVQVQDLKEMLVDLEVSELDHPSLGPGMPQPAQIMDKVAQVLIVEDEPIVSMDLRRKLEAMGYNVAAEIRSGEESIEAATKMRPDVVLMDIKLTGEMDGIDAAERIHDQFDVPIVYLTACADEPTLERAKATKPSGYILKPFGDAQLRAVVEMAIQ